MNSETTDSRDDSSCFNLSKASFHVSDTSTLKSVDTLEGMKKGRSTYSLPSGDFGKMLSFEFLFLGDSPMRCMVLSDKPPPCQPHLTTS